jgi:hypothetical protein
LPETGSNAATTDVVFGGGALVGILALGFAGSKLYQRLALR